MTIFDERPSNEKYQVTLVPARTTLVIIDHQVAFEQCFDDVSIQAVENGVAELVNVAETIEIPIIISLVETNLIDARLSKKLETKLPHATRFSRIGLNPWDDLAFSQAVQSANRPCLLIAGLSAEISLSFTALSALARGYDVYVIKDVCLGYSKESIATSFERMTQAGIVPVSWRQVMLEWNQGSVDVRQLRRILGAKKLRRRKNNSHVKR